MTTETGGRSPVWTTPGQRHSLRHPIWVIGSLPSTRSPYHQVYPKYVRYRRAWPEALDPLTPGSGGCSQSASPPRSPPLPCKYQILSGCTVKQFISNARDPGPERQKTVLRVQINDIWENPDTNILVEPGSCRICGLNLTNPELTLFLICV
jgi:hypothetical protein